MLIFAPGGPRPTLTPLFDTFSRSNLPKLFINAAPGSILVGAQREFCRSWPNQLEVTVPGLHFIQEDSGGAIGNAVASWMSSGGERRASPNRV